MESGAAEQRRLLPSCVRSVCLCGVWGRLTGGREAGAVVTPDCFTPPIGGLIENRGGGRGSFLS